MQCHPYRTPTASSQAPHRPSASNQPPQAVAPMERLMDLLHEVRQFSRHLQRSARQAAGCADESSYEVALHAMLSDRMCRGDERTRILCYASAAELGVPVELQAEHCRQAMSGGLGFPLRVLFWAAHRRMHAGRRPRAAVLTWN